MDFRDCLAVRVLDSKIRRRLDLPPWIAYQITHDSSNCPKLEKQIDSSLDGARCGLGGRPNRQNPPASLIALLQSMPDVGDEKLF
jgi:hypothetical protein